MTDIEIARNTELKKIQEIANELGISRRAVAKQITNLRKKGLISRIGPDKGGYWQVNDNVDTKML